MAKENDIGNDQTDEVVIMLLADEENQGSEEDFGQDCFGVSNLCGRNRSRKKK